MKKYTYKPNNFEIAGAVRNGIFERALSRYKRKQEPTMDYAFKLDGTDDYIAGDTVIGRTGYNMNVSGNFNTGSDSDGSYINMYGNRDATAATGTKCDFGNLTTPSYTQANNITIKARVKFIAFAANNVGGIFGSNNDFALHIETGTSKMRYTVRGSTNVNYDSSALSLNVLYDAYLVYDASSAKFYCYISSGGAASTLLNTGGTSGPATFTANSWYLGDTAIGAGTPSSNNMYIYHAAIRNRALSQAEVDADIALGNTTKSDPTIVAYYIPENLQYNTDYITNKDFTNASWTKTGTVATGGQADLRGGTNAASLAISAGAGNGVTTTNTSITGSILASKVFKLKVFAWTSSGTATMRLRISHNGVATYYSSNQTVTTTPQEFTFTQTLTSSTGGTGMTYGIEVGSGAGAATFIAYYPTDWLTDQTLRDESPNIGGYIGRKTDKVFSCKCKPGADSTNSASAMTLMYGPWFYVHIRDTFNRIDVRYDDRIGAKATSYTLGSGFRDEVQISAVFQWNSSLSVWQLRVYVDGKIKSTTNHSINPPSASVNSVLRCGRAGSSYYNGYIRDARIHTGTITDADARAIYQGGKPANAVEYQVLGPLISQSGVTVDDLSGNGRTATEMNGVTKEFI